MDIKLKIIGKKRFIYKKLKKILKMQKKLLKAIKNYKLI